MVPAVFGVYSIVAVPTKLVFLSARLYNIYYIPKPQEPIKKLKGAEFLYILEGKFYGGAEEFKKKSKNKAKLLD